MQNEANAVMATAPAERSHRGRDGAGANEATVTQVDGGARGNEAVGPVAAVARGPAPTYSDRDLEAMRARYWSRLPAESPAGLTDEDRPAALKSRRRRSSACRVDR